MNGKFKAFSVISGGVLVHLTLGTVYTFGNLTPYLTSYFRSRNIDSTLTYAGSVWIMAMAGVGQGMSVFLGGAMYKKLGARLTVLIGSWFQSFGIFMTYFAVQHSFEATVVTYGVMFGFGVGIAYAIPMDVGMKWFPNYKGLVNGLVVAGFGAGSFIFDQVQTAYINPNNLKPDQTVATDKYFTQDAVLNNVPTIFLIMGGSFASIQLIGVLLLAEPSDSDSDRDNRQIKSDSDNDNITLSQAAEPIDEVVDEVTGESESHITENKEENSGTSVREAIQSRAFWTLWCIYLFNGQGILFISSLFKAYGQTFIHDDHFLTTVGSVSALFNGLGRIVWGHFADRFCCKTGLVFQTGTFTFLVLSFGLTSLTGKPLFFIYVCLLFLSFSGNFSLLPTATAKTFGLKNYSIIYGLVFTASVITSPIGAILTEQLQGSIGWYGMFFIVSGFSFLSLLISWSFNVKDDEKDI